MPVAELQYTERYVSEKMLPKSVGSLKDMVPINENNIGMFVLVREDAAKIADRYLRIKTLEFISRLEVTLGIQNVNFTLPTILRDFRDDESYLEWPFESFTVGFNISKDGSEDGWFLISDDILGVDEQGDHLQSIDMIAQFIGRYGNVGYPISSRDASWN